MALPTDPKEFLMQHGEKVSLGLALAVAAFFVVTTMAGGNAQQTNDEVKSKETQINNKKKIGVKPPAKSADSLAAVSAEWSSLKPKDLPSNWTFYRMPQVTIKRDAGAEPVFVTDPSTLSVLADRENLKVTWAGPPSHLDGKPAAELLGYMLYRWRKGEEKSKTSSPKSKDSTSFDDRNFEPKTTYCYQLVAHFEFKRSGEAGKTSEVIGGTVGVGPPGTAYEGQQIRISKMTNVACATTAVNIKLVFKSKWGAKGELWVWQYWKEGRWWAMRFRIHAGADLGEKVSAQQLVQFNRTYNPGAATFARLQDEAKTAAGRKPSYAWDSGHIYLGSGREGKTQQVAYLEVADTRLVGMGGIDWGYKLIVVERQKNPVPGGITTEAGGGE